MREQNGGRPAVRARLGGGPAARLIAPGSCYFTFMGAASIVFLPDRFMDHRLWSDIPDNLGDQVRVVHYDQHELPWRAPDGGFVEAVRRLTGGRGFQIAAAAGDAARFAVTLAEAGLVKGIVFFQPVLDSIPADVHIVFPGADLENVLDPYQPLIGAVDDSDPGRRRAVVMSVIGEAMGAVLNAESLQVAMSMYGEHFDEFLGMLRAVAPPDAAELETVEAASAGPSAGLTPRWGRPWMDRLEGLPVPVAAMVAAEARIVGEAIVRRTGRGEVIVVEGIAGLATRRDRQRGAEAIRRMLDQVAGG